MRKFIIGLIILSGFVGTKGAERFWYAVGVIIMLVLINKLNNWADKIEKQ